jgi:hypothetical protein
VRCTGATPAVGETVVVGVRDGARVTLFDPLTEERVGVTRGAGIPSALGH